MMRKSKIWIIVGIILLFGAFELTIHNYYEDYQAKENADKDDRWNQVYWRQYVMTPKFVGSWIYLYTMN